MGIAGSSRHVLTGALFAGGFIVAGIGAYYLLAGREPELGRRFVRAGTIAGFIVFGRRRVSDRRLQRARRDRVPTCEARGDGRAIRIRPPARRWRSSACRTAEAENLIDPIYVPRFLSYLAYGNFNANVKGLNAYARDAWPPVELTYYAYHVMVGLGTIFGAVTGIALSRCSSDGSTGRARSSGR